MTPSRLAYFKEDIVDKYKVDPAPLDAARTVSDAEGVVVTVAARTPKADRLIVLICGTLNGLGGK